jgi:hypothetical protein
VSLSPVSNSLDFDIYVVSVDGSESRQLTGESLGDPVNVAETEPSWSPDGKKIIFAQDAGLFTRQLYIMNADDGSERVRLTDNNFDDRLPDWGTSQDTFVKQNRLLTINSEDNSGNPLGGVWTTIRHPVNGTIVQTGFTPFPFEGISGAEYEVSVANYDGKSFHHWQDNGETNNFRRINLNAETKLVARYDTGDSLRGFTPIAFAGSEQQPDLHVNAVTIEGNEALQMYAIIDPQPSSSGGASETTYKVYAGDYQDKLFDHWEDGSEDRVRTLTIDEDTTITAYYRIEFD